MIPHPSRFFRLGTLRPGMVAAFVLLTVVLVAPPRTLAAPSLQVQEHDVRLFCDVLSADGADAYIAPWFNTSFGSDMQLQLWLHPDNIIIDPPTALSSAANLSVDSTDSSLTGTFEVTMGSEVVGSGTLDAQIEPVGDVVEVIYPKSTSNNKHREHQRIQPVSVSGEVRIALGGREIVLPLDGCAGSVADFVAFFNAPAAAVDWESGFAIACVLTDGDMSVAVNGSNSDGLTLVDVTVITPGEVYLSNDDGTRSTLSRTRFALDQALIASGGAGLAKAGGQVTASAELMIQPRVLYTDKSELGTYRLAIQPFEISGSLEIVLNDGAAATFTLSNDVCQVSFVGERVIVTP